MSERAAFESPQRPQAVWSPRVAYESDVAAELGCEADPMGGLVERLERADTIALTLLYKQHHEAVRAFARRLVGDAAIAEDLVHDVFLAVPAAFRRYRRDSGVRTFLISIAVNKAKHHVRAACRLRHTMEKLAGEPVSGDDVSADEALERKQLRSDLQRALDRLPIEQRVVVILCAVEERTAAEVAAIVGAPENTVRTRLFHGRRKLRELMGERP
jgi:RNA polymerase sigma-70 factor, ECF subfamily